MLAATALFTKIPFNYILLMQDNDFMRSVGKIYVVVAVLIIIFIGLALYLFFIDRRISKLEKSNKNE